MMMNMGIRNKLLLGFGAILAILVLSIGVVLVKTSLTIDSARQTIDVDLPMLDKYQNVSGYIYETVSQINAWIVTRDPRVKINFENTWNAIEKNISQIDKNLDNSTDMTSNSWNNLKEILAKIKNIEFQFLQTTDLDAGSNLTKMSVELNPLLNQSYDIINGPRAQDGERDNGIFDKKFVKFKNGANNIISNMESIKLYEYILLGAGIVLAFIIAIVTTNKIVRPLQKAIHVARQIAQGNRDVKIKITSDDETGQLLKSLDTMQSAINENDHKLKNNEAETRKLFDRIVKTAAIFSSHSSKVAEGDLTQRLTINENDEMSELGKDLNTMTDGLANITKEITLACNDMVTTLDEVKSAADMQSSGASEQASSINQITASLEEIEQSSNQTIEKAKMLGEVAERTRVKGQLGLEVVEQSVNGMKDVRSKVQAIAQTILELSNQTQQIGEITAVVNSLSQQSKMLALNASIEAAKAGEAGKGFAVVASEVKNLAEQSEQATIQVQKILEDIRHATERAVIATEEGTKGVDRGTGLVEQTGEVVRGLGDVIHEATIASQQIEAAIRQEGIGIEQITAGMNEINQVTASTVAGVKQTTEAIKNLTVIAKNLRDQIDTYKV